MTPTYLYHLRVNRQAMGKILTIFWKQKIVAPLLLLLRIRLNITQTHTEDPTEKDDYDDENPDNSQLNNTDRYN